MAEGDEHSYDRMDILPTARSGQRRAALCHDLTVLLLGAVAVLALVFSAIALARPGTTTVQVTDGQPSGGSEQSDEKVWLFAIGHDGTNKEYIDKLTGTVRGFHVDIIEAVCTVANKNCRVMWDTYENCYKSDAGELPHPGRGLLGRWYDACTGWFATFERTASVSFSKPFRKPIPNVFYVKRGNPTGFDRTDITGRKIGFIDGSASSEFCLFRAGYTEEQLTTDQIVHLTGRKNIISAVNGGTVDAVFTNSQYYRLDTDLDKVGPPITNCMKDGAGMMVRKDSPLPSWWDPAFEQLKLSSEYQRICEAVTAVHDQSETGVDCVD